MVCLSLLDLHLLTWFFNILYLSSLTRNVRWKVRGRLEFEFFHQNIFRYPKFLTLMNLPNQLQEGKGHYTILGNNGQKKESLLWYCRFYYVLSDKFSTRSRTWFYFLFFLSRELKISVTWTKPFVLILMVDNCMGPFFYFLFLMESWGPIVSTCNTTLHQNPVSENISYVLCLIKKAGKTTKNTAWNSQL